MPPYAFATLGVGIGFFALFLINPSVEQEAAYAPPPVQPQKVTVLFGGDVFFDRTIRTTIEERGGDYIFSCIEDVLQRPDLVVMNLEGPVTDHASVSVGSPVGSPENYRFTFAPDIANLLYAYNIRLVNLGNNHIANFGDAGVASTLAYLRGAGVEYFGEPHTYSVAKVTLHGIPLAFVGYNEFGGTSATTIAQIKEARAEGYLPVVYAHWGTEYETVSSLAVQQLAHEFVDSGAEIVIGSHPHVVQQSEFYNGAYIYYSLGNFIFDQYFSEDVRRGLLVEVAFTKQGVFSVQEIPTYLERDRRTCPTIPTVVI